MVKPTNKFSAEVDYLTSQMGEKGEPVEDGFEYISDLDDQVLSVS